MSSTARIYVNGLQKKALVQATLEAKLHALGHTEDVPGGPLPPLEYYWHLKDLLKKLGEPLPD